MQDFEAIRPYQDEEVPGVIARLIRDPGLKRAAARFLLPRLSVALPGFGDWLIGKVLKHKTRNMHTVAQVQEFLEGYIPENIPAGKVVYVWFDVYDIEEKRI